LTVGSGGEDRWRADETPLGRRWNEEASMFAARAFDAAALIG